jgi:hypothetical protein
MKHGNPLTNPFWLGSWFRAHPWLGLLYHLAKALRFGRRL